MKMYSKKIIPEGLHKAMSLNLQINAKTQELSRWREIAEKASGAIFSHAPSHRNNKSRVEDSIIRIDMIEQAIANDVNNLVNLKAILYDTICKINDPKCQTLLSLRYLCGMPWEEVAEVMDYSYVHVVHRLHPVALQKFKEVMDVLKS